MRFAVHGGHLIPRIVPSLVAADASIDNAYWALRTPHHMSYWLMKSEPSECSIDDRGKVRPSARSPWIGVRNYQARNFMKQRHAAVGDGVLFYHSSCPEPGIAGFAEVVSAAYPDETQFDETSHYFDAKSRREAPRWWHVDVKLVEKTPLLPLARMRELATLASMRTLKRGNRLSITPVSTAEWQGVQEAIASQR